jgi:hypothetical protein
VTETDTRERRTGGPISEGRRICPIVKADDRGTALCDEHVTGYP